MPVQRVLLAGAAGFLGAHLCARLLAAGAEVLAVDDFSTGTEAALAPLRGHPRLTVHRHDVGLPLPATGPLDRVWNLACPASPPHYQADPLRTFRTAVVGTLNLLAVARATGARFLQASTSEVYGDPSVHPQPETYAGHVNPVGPRACYDEGKRAAETACADHARALGMDVRVARIFNTYGPGMPAGDGRVVSALIVQALEGRALTLFGGGRQTRSFCYVDDMIEGLVRLMEHPGPLPGPVNLGNPEEVAVRDLAQRIRALTGGRAPLVDHPLPADDPRRRCPDIGLARRLLGWAPAVPLDDGLARTVADFACRLGRPAPPAAAG
jgi:UDP-glucuronate decarboxylase